MSSGGEERKDILETPQAPDIALGSPEDAANVRPLIVKWGRESLTVPVNPDTTSLGDLKFHLQQQTDVLAHRQKLLGFKIPKPEQQLQQQQQTDAILLSSCDINWKKGIILMGVPEARQPKAVELPEVLDDLDWDYEESYEEASKGAKDEPSNLKKLKKIIKEHPQINLIHPLRPSKPLLVLDIDYTIFDMKGDKANYENLKRPGTDEFLTVAYRYFDVCFWSQTSWRWLELKLTEMNLLSNPSFRIAFVLDKTTMFRIKRVVDGKMRKHSVKPLQYIWHHFPHLNERNTVHVDDLGRNFVMNPRCGIKIQAYKKARKNKELDFQLPLLTEYLLMIEGIERRELEKRHAERTGKAVQDSKKSVPFDEEYDINRYDHQNWQKVLRDAHK